MTHRTKLQKLQIRSICNFFCNFFDGFYRLIYEEIDDDEFHRKSRNTTV